VATGEGGEDALTTRLVAVTDSDCTETGEAVLVRPTEARLKQVDAEVAAGTFTKGSATHLVGSAEEVMEELNAKELVGRGRDDSLWLITADNVGYGLAAFPTPGGNTLWLRSFVVRPAGC
jgi:uncharacterized protein YciU (UPF0263 family)